MASPPDIRDIASTSQDLEDIFQYLLAMPMPFLQYLVENACNKIRMISETAQLD